MFRRIMNVLIIEDSDTIFSVVSQMLNDLGHKAYRAVDGIDGLEKVKASKDYELILLDWNMPNMNGLEFLIENKKLGYFLGPICMMTNEDDPERIMFALEHGAIEYIMKPFTADIVASKISNILEMKHAG
jgi:two-component system, chemotaxis family, chemotaxis protein CheY